MELSKKPVNIFYIYFALSFIALYFIYAPTLYIPFYHHDVYKFSVGGLHQSCQQDYGFENIFIQVRPIVAYMDCLNFKLGNTLEHMSYIRFACVIFSAAFASVLACWMYAYGFTFLTALIVSLTVACLPGIQTGMIMGADHLLISPLLAFIGFLCVEKGSKNKKYLNGMVLSGFLILLATFFIYPAGSSFYLVPAVIFVLFNPLSEWKVTRVKLVRDSIIFIACCVIFFLAGKVIQHIMIKGVFPGGYTLNLSAIDESLKRLGGLLKVLPSLWSTNYHGGIKPIIVYLIIIAGILSAIKFRSDQSILVCLCQPVAGFVFLLLMSSSAFLMQPTYYVFGRILFVPQAINIFVLIWSFKYISLAFKASTKIFISSVVIMGLIAAAVANYTVTKSALNDNTELSYIREFLFSHIMQHDKIQRIHIIGLKMDSKENFNGLYPRDDIFNINSTLYRQDSYYMVDAALKQIVNENSYKLYNCSLDEIQLMHTTVEACMKAAPKDNIIVTYSRDGEPVTSSPGTLIIDMTSRNLYFPTHPRLFSALQAKAYIR